MKFGSILSCLILAACSTYMVKPDSTQLKWNQGVAYQETEKSGVTVRVAVEDSAAGTYSVEIENRSISTVRVAPENFFLENKAHEKYEAESPERLLSRLETQIAEQRGLIYGEGLEAVAFALTTLRKFSGKETEPQRLEREASEKQRESDHPEEVKKLTQLKADRDVIKKFYLNEVELQPNESVRGLIKFERIFTNQKFELYWKSGAHERAFAFQSVKGP